MKQREDKRIKGFGKLAELLNMPCGDVQTSQAEMDRAEERVEAEVQPQLSPNTTNVETPIESRSEPSTQVEVNRVEERAETEGPSSPVPVEEPENGIEASANARNETKADVLFDYSTAKELIKTAIEFNKIMITKEEGINGENP